MKKLLEIWKLLNTPIYTGKRLQENLRALTAVSYFTAGLGLVLIIINLVKQEPINLIASCATFLGGVACAYCSKVKQNRELAALIPTAFCIVAFTLYTFTGFADGTGVLWSLLAPLGLCYFVSVRNGIIVSLYYTVLFFLTFYTPLRSHIEGFYSEAFMLRFPLFYLGMSGFTAISMIQYHRGILLENEYAERLNEEVARQTAVAEARAEKIEQMSFQTILALANAIDAKDPYTKGHSTRVSQYSVMIAETLGWERERINDLRYAAMLHDIGKIGVPDSILNNPKRLTDVEYAIIKSHTTMGGDILHKHIMIDSAEDVARSHHERYDGTGYPLGLRGEAISEEARVVAIADAFDAMSSTRVYRRACSRSYIMHELIEGRGRQFDPHMTDCFLDLWDRGLLDSIANSEAAEDDGSMEASSALLREVMETFLAQSAAEDLDLTTGVMTRTAGEALIARTMQAEPGCFVFFDMDNLKLINDTNGHEAGDKALYFIGQTLQESSPDALCCRLGGDEFLLFIKNASAEAAEATVRKILSDFDQKKASDARLTPAALSAGLVMCTPADSYSKAYSRADKALYHVKQNGKHGFSFYSSESDAAESDFPDLNSLVSGIHSSGTYKGALDVEYRQFAKLYEYVSNLEKRYAHPFKLIMISLDVLPGEDTSVEELEKAMFYMEQSIQQAIRSVDILTRYSRQQFLVILLGADSANVQIAIDRIFRGFYKMNGSSPFLPSCSVLEPVPESEAAAESTVS